MPEEIKAGCTRPELKNKVAEKAAKAVVETVKEEQQMLKVGRPAPNFSAPAYYKGKFVNVNLEDYSGKWVLLCFYPGDFTFV
ncbi:selenocysteine-containing peroxiredoxin PrxU [Andreesenia angusta]|uniref:Selenocysteine-containing peroxiredoxin PrxU n=2 Tax=Andreesenia angusta TaxID=39480 RepID=A0A1S1VBR4_9FIRM|nr:selenocysteine-containing peroxiredoxin PrxU [Andreesenia angusta]